MIFLRPEYLIFMFIPLIVLAYLIVTGKSAVQTIFDPETLRKLTVDNDALGRTGRNILLFTALFLMIVALAHPVMPKGEIKAAVKRIDLVIGLDISRSMLATDRFPNRLTFAKRKIYELLDKFPQARVGVIAFAEDGFLVSPMTEDKQSVRFLIDNLNTEALSTRGTDLLMPIEKAAEFLKKNDQKILILFTDGGDQKDFSKEIEAAKKAHMSVYVYAVGTHRGAPIPWHGNNLKDATGNIVITKLNPTVKTLAFETGGAYIEGGYKDGSIEKLIADIKHKFKMQTLRMRKIEDFKELFYYPLALALFLMLCAFSSLPKRNLSAVILLLAGLSVPLPSYAGLLDFHEIKQGFNDYRQERFRESVRHFEKVVKSRQDAPSWYDYGNALYRSGRYDEAIRAYRNAKTNDPALAYKIFFNLGNAYYKKREWLKALQAYETARKIKTEADLEYNIELTKKHLKKKPPNKGKNRQNPAKKQNKEQQSQKKQPKQNKKQKEKSSNPQQKGGNQKARQERQSRTRPPSISEQEMKKWEKRLRNSKPKTIPLRFKNQNVEREKNAKPW